MKKLYFVLIFVVVFLSFSSFQPAYASGLKHGTCSMTIDSVKNPRSNPAQASGPCSGLEIGWYQKNLNKFIIVGPVNNFNLKKDTQVTIPTPASKTYIDGTLSVYLVKEKISSSNDSKSGSTSSPKTTPVKTTTKTNATQTSTTKRGTTTKNSTSTTQHSNSTSIQTKTTNVSKTSSTKHQASHVNQSSVQKGTSKPQDKKSNIKKTTTNQSQKKSQNTNSKKEEKQHNLDQISPMQTKKRMDLVNQKINKMQMSQSVSKKKRKQDKKWKQSKVSHEKMKGKEVGIKLWTIIGLIVLILVAIGSAYYLVKRRKTS